MDNPSKNKRSRTPEKLAESEQAFLKAIEDSMLAGLAMVDANGRQIHVNSAFMKMVGWSEEELIGAMPPFAYWPSEDAKTIEKSLYSAIVGEGAPGRVEARFKRKDGQIIDVLVLLSPLKDRQGRAAGLLTLIHDISERKRIEATLQQLNDSLEQRIQEHTTQLETSNKNLLKEIAERKRAEKIQTAIYKISQAANSAVRLEDLYPSIHFILGELMPMENFYIALYDAASDVISFPYLVDQYDQAPLPHKPGRGLTEYVLRTKRPLLASPEVFEKLIRSGEVEAIGSPSVDWLGAPLKVEDRTIGVIVVQSYKENVRFGQEETDILEFVSSQVAMVIERKQMEQRMAEALSFNQTILETSPYGIATFNSSGDCVSANEAATKITGANREEILKLNFRNIQSWKNSGMLQAAEEALSGGSEKRYDVHLVNDFGKEVWLDVSLVPFLSGGENHLLLIFTDIMARKHAEEQLCKAEEKYHALFEESKDVVFISTAESKLLDINQAGIELFGYPSKEELLQVNIARDLYFNPSDRDAVTRAYETIGYLKDFEVVLKRKNGEKIVVLETSTVVHDEAGKVVAFRGILRDVTGQRALSRQLLQAQKMEAVGHLAGGVAHDFNNLLTAIIGYSQLALESLPEDHPVRDKIEEIVKAGERASALTAQLLAFSRQQVLQPRVVDLNTVVTDIEKMLRQLIGEHIDLITLLDPKLGNVKADPGQLGQVILNLAVNARDAMPQGGRLTLETRNVDLDETFTRNHWEARPGSFVMIRVKDTGMGMDADTQTHLFEPFFTTKEPGKGTGLGLSTVYGIVKQSGGHIVVCSEVGKGSTFTVYLPRIDEPAIENSSNQKKGPLTTGSETVLLVEDEDSVRALGKEILEMNGYKVLEASNGKEAIQMTRQNLGKIHLLVTDMIMPEMNGRVLAQRLWATQPDLKVLYISGYPDPDIRTQGALGAGVAYLQKPFTPYELARKIREILAE